MRSIRKLRQRIKKNPTDIPYDVKISVAIRDNGVCVNCKNKIKMLEEENEELNKNLNVQKLRMKIKSMR